MSHLTVPHHASININPMNPIWFDIERYQQERQKWLAERRALRFMGFDKHASMKTVEAPVRPMMGSYIPSEVDLATV